MNFFLGASAVTILFHISSQIGRNGDKRQAASQSEWARQSWQVRECSSSPPFCYMWWERAEASRSRIFGFSLYQSDRWQWNIKSLYSCSKALKHILISTWFWFSAVNQYYTMHEVELISGATSKTCNQAAWAILAPGCTLKQPAQWQGFEVSSIILSSKVY